MLNWARSGAKDSGTGDHSYLGLGQLLEVLPLVLYSAVLLGWYFLHHSYSLLLGIFGSDLFQLASKLRILFYFSAPFT